MRIGNGYDVHPLVPGRDLILGGIAIPYELGLHGHSDGDALTHAIIDALLGAAGLGDIGMRFPPNDPQFAGVRSILMLEDCMRSIADKKLKIEHVDSVIICEKPKLSPYFAVMRESLEAAMGIDWDKVNVKATTNEGLGFLGRGEAIAVHAVALLS